MPTSILEAELLSTVVICFLSGTLCPCAMEIFLPLKLRGKSWEAEVRVDLSVHSVCFYVCVCVCVFPCVVSRGRETDIATAALHQSTSCHQRAGLEICPKCVCVHWGGVFTCECVRFWPWFMVIRKPARVQIWSTDLPFLHFFRKTHAGVI